MGRETESLGSNVPYRSNPTGALFLTDRIGAKSHRLKLPLLDRRGDATIQKITLRR
jgi:hypothetical protein